MEDKKIKVIYIAGSGHCGSTLLDMIIGSIKGVFTTGELALYSVYRDKFFYKIKNRKIYLCTCGSNFDDCEVWKNVNESGDFKIKKIYNFWENCKIAFFILFPFLLKNKSKYKDQTDLLLDEIRKKNKDIEFFVDSSKDPRRLFNLLNNENLEVYPIFLAREAQAVAYSYNKKIRAERGMKRHNIYLTIFKWILINFFISRLIRNNKKAMQISYKNFCMNTEKVIEEINNKFGIKITKNFIADIKKTKYHNIDGNRNVKTKGIGSIDYNQEWKNHLSKTQIFLASIISRPFNKKWAEK